MKKYEIYIIEILLFISIIMFNIVYKSVLFQNLSIIIISIYAIVRFGLMKDNNYLKNMTTKIVLSSILLYFITIYALGLIMGFNKSPFSLNINYIFNIIVLESIVIVFEEILRYIIARNTQHRKLPLIIYTIILIILNVIIEINGYSLNNGEVIFIFITTIIIPTISIQAVCSYLTYKVSYKPSIILNISISLYQYILPIIPNIGNYLYAVANTALPYIIYFSTSRLNQYKDKVNMYKNTLLRKLLYVPIIIIIVILVLLVSGISNDTIIAVGSGSMSPTYDRGDAIIYQKTKIDDIKIGEILAFKKSNKVITHRIVNIEKNNKYIIYTKGDANKNIDSWTVNEQEVLGIVKLRIKYLGYPTLWFNEIINGKEKE